MILSRLKITGELNFNTPKVVLDEIADVLCIKEKNPFRLILKINKSGNKNKISEDYKNDVNSLRVIARYVNPKQKNWKRSLLLQAFDFLESFGSEHVERNIFETPNFFYGSQTTDNPKSLNACVLYHLCQKYNIQTNYDLTLKDMAQNVKIYVSNIENSLKIELFNYLKYEAEKKDLINILNVVGLSTQGEQTEEGLNESQDAKQEERLNEETEETPNKDYSFQEYEICADEIFRLDDENIKPKNCLEAIVMGALYYKIDLSSCKNPIEEYNYVSYVPNVVYVPYFPKDNNLKDRLRETHLHPETLKNPYLNQKFNLKLPSAIYSQRDLVYLCGQEGISIVDDTYYSALQLAYLTDTFVHGKQGHIQNHTTTFLEDIDDLSYDQVVIYGSRCENRFTAYTYAELADVFSIYKRFSSPQTNELFSEEAIDKLYLLCQKDKRKSETEETYTQRCDLAEEIERIKIYISSKNEYVEEFLELYEELVENEKKKVEKCLTDLLHVSMYMRNWDGQGEYPLRSEETNFSSENQIIVDDRVTQSLIVFEKSATSLGKIGDFILHLPLMQYHHESNTFVTTNDPAEGLTIKDRIFIVRGGESESLNSCIRMSSNKFCATSYFYMVLIGFRMPFSIGEVSHIV